MTGRELMASWFSLSLIGFLLFLPHIVNGGLYLDDWPGLAHTLHPAEGSGLATGISYFNDLLSSARPVVIVISPLKYLLVDGHSEVLLAIAAALAILAAGLAYAVLRVLGIPWFHAWTIAALTLAYPWFDSTRFWDAASPITMALALALAGLWLALAGLSRGSLRLHAAAAFLYLLSMLTYEVTLPLVAMVGLLYMARNGWRAAKPRWGIDLAVVAIAALWNWLNSPKTVSTFSDNIDHLRIIVMQGGELLGRTLYPLGSQPRTAAMLILLALTFLAAITLQLLPRNRGQQGQVSWGLRSWLLLAGGGLIVAGLGWAIFVPADPYYSPSIFGVTNRVNGLAGFGLIVVVYAALGIVGCIAGQIAKGQSWLAPTVTVSLALILGASYVHVLERHSGLWNDAYNYASGAADLLRTTFPDLPAGTTVYTSNYPANVTLGVVVFATTWDLDGMVKLTYADHSLRGFPITPDLPLDCRRSGAMVGEEDSATPIAPYGSLRIIDLQSGRFARPRSRRECLRQKPKYPPGPLYLATDY